MIDAGGHDFVKLSANSDRVLVPQPSNDPSDPLVSPARCQSVLEAEGVDRPLSTIELERLLESLRDVLRNSLKLHPRSRAAINRTHDSAAD